MDKINNDLVTSVDVERIVDTLIAWSGRLRHTGRDDLVYNTLENVYDIICDNIVFWEG